MRIPKRKEEKLDIRKRTKIIYVVILKKFGDYQTIYSLAVNETL